MKYICAIGAVLLLCSSAQAAQPKDIHPAAAKAMAYEKGTATIYKKKKKRYYKYRKSSKSKWVSRRAPTPVSRETMAAVEAMDNAPLPQQPVKTWTILSPWPTPQISQIQMGEQSPFPTERFEAVFAPAPAPLPRKQHTDPRWYLAGMITLLLMLAGSMFIPITRLRGVPEPPSKGVIFLDHHRRKAA